MTTESYGDSCTLKILFVSTIMPYPPIYGSAIRTWSLLRALASEGVGTTLVTFASHSEAQADLRPLYDVCHSVHLVNLAQKSLTSSPDYLGRATALLSPAPFATARYRSDEMYRLVQEQLSKSKFDAVFADTLFSLVNMPPVECPLIANGHNVEYLILKRYLQFEKNPAKRAYAWMETEKLRRWERSAFRRANLGVACSNYDREVLLAGDTTTPIAVIPNVIDTDYYSPCPAEGEPFTVMYQGGMDWFPNRDAVQYFTSSILPVLRKRIPNVRFIVAGRNPTPEFLRNFENDPAISFTGTVDDMRSVIQRAQVCVVPLRIGSGTRLKILEASAMEKPVVSTSLGAEGLSLIDGSEIILRDDPNGFANAVADLLLDRARRASLGAAARRRVESSYSFPALCAAVHAALEAITTHRRAVAGVAGR